MIIYNVTVKVDHKIKDEWLKWMRQEHIPQVMNTGLFTSHRMMRLLEQDETDGVTFAIQYFCSTWENYAEYIEHYASALRTAHPEKFTNKFFAFRTVMEII